MDEKDDDVDEVRSHQFKIILLGDGAVGKVLDVLETVGASITSIICRFPIRISEDQEY